MVSLDPIHNKTIQSGFSLIELVVVIGILGILSLTVVPRFSGSSGFSEFAAQQQLHSALRAMQTKSMYDSSGAYCYRMIFDVSGQTIGPTVATYSSSTAVASCANSIASDAPDAMSLKDAQLSGVGVTFSAVDGGAAFSHIQFDAMGMPYTSVGRCVSGCEVTFSGEQSVKICIGAQGYVYEC